MTRQHTEKNKDFTSNDCLAKVYEIMKVKGIQLNESLIKQLNEYCFTKDTVIGQGYDNIITVCTKVEHLTIQLNIHSNGDCDRICWVGIM